ncbi:MAG: hypothetical protein MHM6MM_004872 [Cercozoa sp. M6MM]
MRLSEEDDDRIPVTDMEALENMLGDLEDEVLSDDSGLSENEDFKKTEQTQPLLMSIGDDIVPEDDEGYVEYKWKLVDLTRDRISHLATQMRFRMSEGGGHCFYMLGYGDDGRARGLDDDEFDETLNSLRQVAKFLSDPEGIVVQLKLARTAKTATGKRVAVVIARQRLRQSLADVRIAVAGHVDAGKSTLVGVLTTGRLDDGRGSARASVCRHPHELRSGRTSARAYALLGFDRRRACVNLSLLRASWDEILARSHSLVTFVDLAGHEKHLRSTVSGLTGCSGDAVLLVVGAAQGVSKMTREHVNVADALCLPMIVAVTKTDTAPKHKLRRTLRDVRALIGAKRCRFVNKSQKNTQNAESIVPHLKLSQHVPVVLCSSVTGTGLEVLRSVLYAWTQHKADLHLDQHIDSDTDSALELSIEESFLVQGVGVVVGGTVLRGTVSTGDKVLLGPDEKGRFRQVTVRSLHFKRRATSSVSAGQSATLALRGVKRHELRKGMVVLHSKALPEPVVEFDAWLAQQPGQQPLREGYELLAHAGTVRQTVTLLQCYPPGSLTPSPSMTSLNTQALLGSSSSDDSDAEDTPTSSLSERWRWRQRVRMRFRTPQYIRVGQRFVLRDGHTKALGEVVRIHAAAAACNSA